MSWGPDVWDVSQNALDIVLLPTFLTNITSEMYLRVSVVSRSLSCIVSIDGVAIDRGSTEGLAGKRQCLGLLLDISIYKICI